MVTCAIRPAGIYGEKDTTVTYKILEHGSQASQTVLKMQLGDNDNLFDFTYVGNIAYAHMLAGHRLLATYDRYDAGHGALLEHERVDGEAFNITNGDAFRWRHMWPRLATMLGLACGEPRDIRLADWMKDKGPVWERIVGREGLVPQPLEATALWAFGDFVFRQDWDVLSNLTRLRRTGFAGSIDSAEMFARQFTQYRAARLMPTVRDA